MAEARLPNIPGGPMKHLRPGDNTTRGTIPADAADAKARGLTEGGMPWTDDKPGAGASGAGVNQKDLVSLIKGFMAQELTDQNDLHAFCEMGRALCHRLAVETHLASGELTAGAKEMGRHNRSWGAVFKMRRVTKRLDRAGDGFATLAAEFVGAWTQFETAFGELLDGADKPKRTKHFAIKI